MQKVTLQRVSHFTKDKEGNDLMGSNGKPYTRCLIDVKEYDQPLSGFGNSQTSSWSEGQEVELEVQEVEKNGNTYYNFSLPKQSRGGIDPKYLKMIEEIHAAVVKPQQPDF